MRQSDPTSRFGSRAERDFLEALLLQLQQKPFEKITVAGICEGADYPRSTFYNYYEDIYDLLEHLWLKLREQALQENYLEIPEKERPYRLFDSLYAVLDLQRPVIENVLQHNAADSPLFESFRHYLRLQVADIMSNCPCTSRYPFPYPVIAEHYSNTILLVLECCFIRKEKLDKEDADRLLRYLLKDI